MKTIKNYVLTFSIIACTLSACSIESTNVNSIHQNLENATKSPTNLDTDMEAPKTHKIILANNSVRILEVTLASGETKIYFIMNNQVCFKF